jgi:hypothetical protein
VPPLTDPVSNVKVLAPVFVEHDLGIARQVAQHGIMPPWTPAGANAANEADQLKSFLDFSDSAVPPDVAAALGYWGFVRGLPEGPPHPRLSLGARIDFDFRGADGATYRTRGVVVHATDTVIRALGTDETNEFKVYEIDPQRV